MAYDKPKVTIDLDEYSELIEKAKTVNADEFIQDAKIVIATFLNSKLNPGQTTEILKRNNIAFAITDTMGGELKPSNIIIKKISPNK